MSEKIPKLEPVKLKTFESKQSKYEQVGKLPLRDIILGPSGSGKGIFAPKSDLRCL